MTVIGGKHRKQAAPTQPQIVVQQAAFTNAFALFGTDDKGNAVLSWVGDPNSASKFNSKYEAKSRVRDIADVPDTRVFKVLEA